jgi:UDP-N-acetylmuramoylalanine--D-glutamate ligase
VSKITKNEFTMPITELSLDGKHNVKNAMAAIAVAQLKNIRKKTIIESLSNFQGVEHRLEKVLKIQGVEYINDSKATNTNSAYFALDSMNAPTVWIVGGVDKRAFVNTSSAPTKRTRSSTDTSSFSTDRHQRDLI